MLRVYSALIDVKRNFKLTRAFECYFYFTWLEKIHLIIKIIRIKNIWNTR